MNNFIYRPTQVSDLSAMHELLPSWMVPDPEVRAALPKLWQDWLESGAMQARTIVSGNGEGSQSFEAFGATVFLEDEFIRRHLAKPQPFLANTLYQLALRGHAPILTPAQVARANWTKGLNLFVLHYCQRMNIGDTHFGSMLAVAHSAFRDTIEGYDLNLLWQEAFTKEEVDLTMSGGMKVVCDYPTYYKMRENTIDPQMRPCLVGMTREHAARELLGTTLSFTFRSHAPVFYFTPMQKRVLALALQGESDTHIALQMNVSVNAVKQGWRAIYNRVGSVTTVLEFEKRCQNDTFTNHQRRRTLLDYLRSHPEEMRPLSRRRDTSQSGADQI